MAGYNSRLHPVRTGPIKRRTATLHTQRDVLSVCSDPPSFPDSVASRRNNLPAELLSRLLEPTPPTVRILRRTRPVAWSRAHNRVSNDRYWVPDLSPQYTQSVQRL